MKYCIVWVLFGVICSSGTLYVSKKKNITYADAAPLYVMGAIAGPTFLIPLGIVLLDSTEFWNTCIKNCEE